MENQIISIDSQPTTHPRANCSRTYAKAETAGEGSLSLGGIRKKQDKDQPHEAYPCRNNKIPPSTPPDALPCFKLPDLVRIPAVPEAVWTMLLFLLLNG